MVWRSLCKHKASNKGLFLTQNLQVTSFMFCICPFFDRNGCMLTEEVACYISLVSTCIMVSISFSNCKNLQCKNSYYDKAFD